MANTAFNDIFSEEIWNLTYKDHNDKDVNDTLRRVAKAIASVEETEELRATWEENFYDMLTNFKGVPGGRILSNAGTEWHGTTLANCFVGPRLKTDIDSLAGILYHLESQAQTLKSEGGWGENFSYIRPRGAFIHGIGVETPGAVKYMELFDKTSEIITAGSGKKSEEKKAKGKIRKGAQMAVLDVWHPDIIEFITAKQQPGRLTKFNVSVNCSDEFMEQLRIVIDLEKTVELNVDAPAESLELLKAELENADKWDLIFPDTTHPQYKKVWNGDIKLWKEKGFPVKVFNTVSIRWLWNLIMESTYNRAEPGVLFLDRANYYNPMYYGETIFATNPSMPAGTKVYTNEGIFNIEELEGKFFKVKSLDGRWADANCFKSGTNKELIRISFGSQKLQYVRSTKEHKWPVFNKQTGEYERRLASDLKVGDLLPLNLNQLLEFEGNDFTEDEGFFVGYFLGDGWFSERKDKSGYSCGLIFGKDELPEANRILQFINSRKNFPSTIKTDKKGYHYIQFTDRMFIVNYLMNRYGLLPSKKKIPDIVWKSNNDFITGFIDGLLSSDGSVSEKINFKSSRKDLAIDFAKLLSFYGIKTRVYESNGVSSFPNKKNYNKTYSSWAVEFDPERFMNVLKISHTIKKEKLQRRQFSKKSILREFIKISNVEVDNQIEDVWDISVNHNQHVFPAEWCYTGNCGEQVLSPGNICCLGSLNLTQFVNQAANGFILPKIKKYVGYMVRFLDNVNTYSTAPLPEYVESMRKKRRIGLGVLGWGSSLFMMKIRFASEEANAIRDELMQTIARAAYETSIDLAIEKGKFEYCDPVKHAEGPFVKQLKLSNEYMEKLRTTGIRNSSLMSQQPTGTTSIFANITSGGIEPIFMPEYIRTTIVPTIPDDMIGITPKYYEGEWKETEIFKFEKEGSDEILRGTFNGVVYKIDRSRGLTKEVLCEDYGVHWLKERNEWDPNASWAVTTNQISAIEHVIDLKGFSKYTDSSCSKTINIPHDYSFDDFKNIYLDAYKTGYIKGLTTYRSGTMAAVLSVKDESDASNNDEEIIIDEVKMPTSSPAIVKVLKAEGRKWYLTVVEADGSHRPYALFAHTNSPEKGVTTNDAVERIIALARKKGIKEEYITGLEEKLQNENNVAKITRSLSLLLRHGVLIKNIVYELGKVEGVYVNSFLFQITKFLSQYIKDGTKVEGAECTSCGSQNVVFSEGCYKCVNCGSSKC